MSHERDAREVKISFPLTSLHAEHVFNVFTLRFNTFVDTHIHLSAHTCRENSPSIYMYMMWTVQSKDDQREQHTSHSHMAEQGDAAPRRDGVR